MGIGYVMSQETGPQVLGTAPRLVLINIPERTEEKAYTISQPKALLWLKSKFATISDYKALYLTSLSTPKSFTYYQHLSGPLNLLLGLIRTSNRKKWVKGWCRYFISLTDLDRTLNFKYSLPMKISDTIWSRQTNLPWPDALETGSGNWRKG